MESYLSWPPLSLSAHKRFHLLLFLFLQKKQNKKTLLAYRYTARNIQIATFGYVSGTNQITALRYAWANQSVRVCHKIRVPQCVATESTLHWHTQRKTLTKLCGRVFLRQLAVTEQFWFCLWRRKGSKHHHILREGLCLVSSRSKGETALRDETKQWLWMRLQEAWHQCSLFLPAVI